jgi:hypothetical protein
LEGDKSWEVFLLTLHFVTRKSEKLREREREREKWFEERTRYFVGFFCRQIIDLIWSSFFPSTLQPTKKHNNKIFVICKFLLSHCKKEFGISFENVDYLFVDLCCESALWNVNVMNISFDMTLSLLFMRCNKIRAFRM